MKRNDWMEDLQKSLSDLIVRSPAADIERNVKAFMGQAFTRMDLITREEFDIQADLLARQRSRIDALEQRISDLESRLTHVEAAAKE